GLGWTRAGDGAQRLGELAEVGAWQPAGDVFAGDGGQDRGALGQQVAACGGDRGVDQPAVGGRGFAGGQSGGYEPVDDLGDAALAHGHLVGDVDHALASVRAAGEGGEHVRLCERQAAGGAELAVDDGEQRAVGGGQRGEHRGRGVEVEVE